MARALLLGCLIVSFACSKGPQPPNVLIVSMDSLRVDHLGIYGHKAEFAPELEVSPHVDSIGQRGVVFDSAWSTTSWTLPSHMALLTGLSDRVHGVETEQFQLDPLRKTLAESFQAAGYQTAGFYSGPYLDPRYGFGRGFDSYEYAVPDSELEDLPSVRTGAEAVISSPTVSARGINFLERTKDEPFFLFLHYFDAHFDYVPDEAEVGLAKRFDPNYQGEFSGHDWYRDPRVRDPRPPHGRRIKERDLAHVKALYDSEINWVDRHIGMVLDKLRDSGLEENTVVVFLGDHGDEFFEHDSIGHCSTLYTELTHIPMMMMGPGVPVGKRVAQTVRIFDLAPTVMDLAGVTPFQTVEGISLTKAWSETPAPRPGAFSRVYIPHPNKPFNIREAWRKGRFSVLRTFRQASANGKLQPYIYSQIQTPFMVFDREKDPGEHFPLHPKDPRFRLALKAYGEDFSAAESFANKFRWSPFEDRLAEEVGEDESSLLEQLGYVSQGHGDQPLHPSLGALPSPSIP